MSTRHINSNQYLFCPGPVLVADNVKFVLSNLEIGHREPEFSYIFTQLQKKTLEVFEIKNKRFYYPVFITGSGTAANEAVLSSVVGEKKILIISNGEFGERLAEISSIHNPHTYHLKFEWGQVFKLSSIKKTIKNLQPDVVAVVHHETSTGMLNPIVKIGQLLKSIRPNSIFFVDTVSSAGAEEIEIEEGDIDFISTSASKALGSIPGLSMVIGKVKAFEALKNNPPRTAYLNLYKFYRYAKDYKQTPNTPAVQLFGALEQAMSNILVRGVDEIRQDLKLKAKLIKRNLKKLGFDPLFSSKNNLSSVLTTFKIPEHILVNDFKSALKTFGFVIYDGKGPFRGKVFQVANIGEVTFEQIDSFLNAVKTVTEHYSQPTSTIKIDQSSISSLQKHSKLMYN